MSKKYLFTYFSRATWARHWQGIFA